MPVSVYSTFSLLNTYTSFQNKVYNFFTSRSIPIGNKIFVSQKKIKCLISFRTCGVSRLNVAQTLSDTFLHCFHSIQARMVRTWFREQTFPCWHTKIDTDVCSQTSHGLRWFRCRLNTNKWTICSPYETRSVPFCFYFSI